MQLVRWSCSAVPCHLDTGVRHVRDPNLTHEVPAEVVEDDLRLSLKACEGPDDHVVSALGLGMEVHVVRHELDAPVLREERVEVAGAHDVPLSDDAEHSRLAVDLHGLGRDAVSHYGCGIGSHHEGPDSALLEEQVRSRGGEERQRGRGRFPVLALHLDGVDDMATQDRADAANVPQKIVYGTVAWKAGDPESAVEFLWDWSAVVATKRAASLVGCAVSLLAFRSLVSLEFTSFHVNRAAYEISGWGQPKLSPMVV